MQQPCSQAQQRRAEAAAALNAVLTRDLHDVDVHEAEAALASATAAGVSAGEVSSARWQLEEAKQVRDQMSGFTKARLPPHSPPPDT